MRILSSVTLLLAASSTSSSLSIQNPSDAISSREAKIEVTPVDAPWFENIGGSLADHLKKRRGGRSSGGSSSTGSSSGSSSSGSRGSGNTGTASSSTSASPAYGGGRYYGGGSTSAYAAGASSPRGIAPYVLGGAALGIFPGLWLGAAYAYPYSHPYRYHNGSNASEPVGMNETIPVTCLCQEYSACGCDDNDDYTYLDSILGNGSYSSLNSSLVNIANVNGTKTVVLNGTLPNGTDDSTASNSTSTAPSSSSTTSGVTSSATRQMLLEVSGYWVMVTIVGASVWMT